MSKVTFENLGIDEDFNPYYKEHGIFAPNEVQQKIIPKFMDNRSIICVAQTGTGKTLSYALPVSELIKCIEDSEGLSRRKSKPFAVVIAPTKELAIQIERVFKDISHHVKLRIRSLVGGQRNKVSKTLQNQSYEILIATPNRLTQAIQKKEVSMQELKWLVFDEADTLFDMGFNKDIESILNYTPIEQTHITLFSATLPKSIEEFVKEKFYQKKLQSISFGSSHKVQQKIETFNIYVSPKEKMAMLRAFLEKTAKGRGIVFVNQKNQVDEINEYLTKSLPKLKYRILHGGLGQKQRLTNHKAFVDKKAQVLVATDVAARGIDIKDLQWVFNYGLPKSAEFYLHRCGRTGRAGQKGEVYNLVTHYDAKLIGHINMAIKGQSNLDLDFIQADIKSTEGKPSKTKSKVKKKSKRIKITKRTKR